MAAKNHSPLLSHKLRRLCHTRPPSEMILLSIKLPVKPVNEILADTRGRRHRRTDESLSAARFQAGFCGRGDSAVGSFLERWDAASPCMSQLFNSKLYLDFYATKRSRRAPLAPPKLFAITLRLGCGAPPPALSAYFPSLCHLMRSGW